MRKTRTWAQEAQGALLYALSNLKSVSRKTCAELQFVLPKGSYATVVLREYMKSLECYQESIKEL